MGRHFHKTCMGFCAYLERNSLNIYGLENTFVTIVVEKTRNTYFKPNTFSVSSSIFWKIKLFYAVTSQEIY
jgi:hypothetical protein